MFREYYKFPLKLYAGKALTDDNNMAFDFLFDWMSDDCIEIPTGEQKLIVAILNTEENTELLPLTGKLKYRSSDATITMNGKPFILMRGWGMLNGGLKIKAKEAAEIQDAFAEFIINRLTNHNEKNQRGS